MMLAKKRGILMTVGERIKRIREFRDVTQKELGLALGYPENSAAVRIAQYEASTRVPKIDTAREMAKILRCNFVAIYDGNDLGRAERIMQEFFWLEEMSAGYLYVFQLERYNNNEDERIVFGSYNDYNLKSSFPPIAIALDYNLVNDFMAEWAIRCKEYRSKLITWSEYFEWKINWPNSCDDCGKIIPTVNWRQAK